MAETYENEQIEEKVILVGISEQDGDDAEDSLAELVKEGKYPDGEWK